MLSPPLSRNMLHHQLAHVSLHEAANEPGIPELRSNSQVFAAAHQRVGLAALGRGGDAVRVEVLLFAAGEGDETAGYCQCLVSRLIKVSCHVSYRPPQTSPYSLVTSFPVTIVSPLGARPQPPGPNALFNMRRYLISGR
jgi:hypothetical protein